MDDLKNLFLFELLTMEEIEAVSAAFKRQEYEAGAKIFLEGDKGNALYVIISGEVKIVKGEGGAETELIRLAGGDFFGEIALFEYVTRTASALAVELTSLLEISRDNFNDFFAKKPDISAKLLYQMMGEMARRLRRSSSPDGGLIL